MLRVAYIHAIIDNLSRKILAWTIGSSLDPSATCRLLVEAGQHLVPADARPTITVMADSGVENVNAPVDATLLAERLHRVLAQVEVTESNSMIEAWWRSLNISGSSSTPSTASNASELWSRS